MEQSLQYRPKFSKNLWNLHKNMKISLQIADWNENDQNASGCTGRTKNFTLLKNVILHNCQILSASAIDLAEVKSCWQKFGKVVYLWYVCQWNWTLSPEHNFNGLSFSQYFWLVFLNSGLALDVNLVIHELSAEHQ